MPNKPRQFHICTPPLTGWLKTGDTWTCRCGREYVYTDDEAEGGSWDIVPGKWKGKL